jgi:flavin-dependent dehydrogenase
VVKHTSAEVVIAGGGPAAAATAIALRSSGISVLMLLSTRPVFRMAEAIPAAALPLFEALGLTSLIRGHAVPVRGLESWLDGENPLQRRDLFLLVDRAEFAKRMLDTAILHGAATELADRLPVLIHGDRGVRVAIDERGQQFEAAIDATGRAAIWSRPLKRRRPTRLAHVFQSPPVSSPTALKLMPYESGWAYRIGLRSYMTSVLISSGVRSGELPENLAQAFATSAGVSTLIGHRAASVQWAECPVHHRTITVGDAALAHDPVSGQGIRFALASALAAASVIRTWRNSPYNETSAGSFYSEFVATELRRHLRFVDSFYERPSQVVDEGTKSSAGRANWRRSSDDRVFFSGRVEVTPLQIDGLIESAHAIRLGDGGSVRWLGGFDLLKLRSLTRPAVTVPRLIELLSREGVERDRAAATVSWCFENGILATKAPKE